MGDNVDNCSPRRAGTTLEQAAAAQPAWLRGNPAAKERLTAAAKATRALARPPPPAGTNGGGGGGGAALNASQAAAVEAALGRTLTLWQGPPGTGEGATPRILSFFCQAMPPFSRSRRSAAAAVPRHSQAHPPHPAPPRPSPPRPPLPPPGKTRTLLRFCQAALPLLPSGGQVLAVAASNVAVDNLVGGLVALGVKVVRIGQPVKVRPVAVFSGGWALR